MVLKCNNDIQFYLVIFAGVSKNTLPDDIHNILGFVIDGRPMSTVEYDKLIKYFAKRRENALREEYGDNIPPSLANPPLGPPIDPKVKAAQVNLF